MRELILGHEPAIRLIAFFGVLALMALWELAAPRRSAALGRWARWPSNLGIVALNTVVVRLMLPTTAVALALVGEAEGWGFLHHVGLPGWLALIVGVVALDLVVYLRHVMVHAIPALWRLHRVHHSVEDDETNSNFGFNLPWWDRLFGTYRDQPRGGHDGMAIGIHGWRDPRQVDRLPGMLALPFLGKVTDYAINRRQWAPPGAGHE